MIATRHPTGPRRDGPGGGGLERSDGSVEVCPGWITVVDGGSARTGPPAAGVELPVNQAFRESH